MRSAAGKIIKEALPGQPAEVTGLRGVPQAGDEIMVLPRCAMSSLNASACAGFPVALEVDPAHGCLVE
jgi:hypothetical protein